MWVAVSYEPAGSADVSGAEYLVLEFPVRPEDCWVDLSVDEAVCNAVEYCRCY